MHTQCSVQDMGECREDALQAAVGLVALSLAGLKQHTQSGDSAKPCNNLTLPE